WRKMSERVGYWADMDAPYVTYHNNYIESEWWALKKIWEKNLLYKGHKIVPYCPRCGTSLSSHEVSQGYKDVTEKSVFIKFKAIDEDNTCYLAWTTTPWTLPSNVALAVNPNETYVYVNFNGETLVLAKALLEKVMSLVCENDTLENDYKIIKECTGKDLEYKQYQPLFDIAKPDKKAYYIVCADYVTMSDGCGIVHTAPAFGEDDATAGRMYDLPFVQMVNTKGEFISEVKQWAGMFVKDADPLIIEYLNENGFLFKALDYTHSYPFCWRCDTPLIYYARNTWFIEMTKVRDNLLENNNTINWMPENIKNGRFGNFLENVVDWGLSRERYWGTPLPIWECTCGHRDAVGSIEELRKRGVMADNSPVPEDIELHKPFIDKVHLTCEKCGSVMKRVSEVIDCWFDSGSMPFAQWHYPFENKKIFEENFPANFISEAIDQTRGWFYTLIAISTLLFDQAPYKNVIVMGHVQDKDGKKMSKHLGNVISPNEVLDNQGADAVRWYFYANSSPWLPNRFYLDAVSEFQRKFMGTLNNTYAFYVLYADIDNFNPNNYNLQVEKLGVMDKWILSKLNNIVKIVDENLENYKITESARALQEFVDEMSNWYVRCNRKRFWQTEMNQDKQNAFMTLYTVLMTLSKIIAPFTPFLAEQIYQNIVKIPDTQNVFPDSVHMCDFPMYDKKMTDEDLETKMDIVSQITTLGRNCRNASAIKNRQPLLKLFINCDCDLSDNICEIIKDELNIKQIEKTDDMSGFMSYKFKPQLKTVGPKYGKIVGRIGSYLSTVDGDLFMKQLNEKSKVEFEIDGSFVVLTKDDLLISTDKKDGFVTDSDNGISVALDTNLTQELINEGYLREVISKIQTMRKNAGYEVTDKILFGFGCENTLSDVITDNYSTISVETLCVGILNNFTDQTFKAEWNINGIEAEFYIQKV
ncbi:MAG: isoleucine--tRNA ligase, partial [Clostridia bacterium]